LQRGFYRFATCHIYKCDIEKDSVCREGFTEMNKVTPEEVAFFEHENICNGQVFITDRGKALF